MNKIDFANSSQLSDHLEERGGWEPFDLDIQFFACAKRIAADDAHTVAAVSKPVGDAADVALDAGKAIAPHNVHKIQQSPFIHGELERLVTDILSNRA